LDLAKLVFLCFIVEGSCVLQVRDEAQNGSSAHKHMPIMSSEHRQRSKSDDFKESNLKIVATSCAPSILRTPTRTANTIRSPAKATLLVAVNIEHIIQ
jgi:hypothetical protein